MSATTLAGLQLPLSFKPHAVDGEMDGFELVPLSRLIELIESPVAVSLVGSTARASTARGFTARGFTRPRAPKV